MYHQTPHTLPYHKAKAYLDLHGSVMCTAITADGLLATAWEGIAECPDATIEDKDAWYEVAVVFPIDENGRVATKPIRDWLGY